MDRRAYHAGISLENIANLDISRVPSGMVIKWNTLFVKWFFLPLRKLVILCFLLSWNICLLRGDYLRSNQPPSKLFSVIEQPNALKLRHFDGKQWFRNTPGHLCKTNIHVYQLVYSVQCIKKYKKCLPSLLNRNRSMASARRLQHLHLKKASNKALGRTKETSDGL